MECAGRAAELAEAHGYRLAFGDFLSHSPMNAGGVPAVSRGLSESASDTPGTRVKRGMHPAGMPAAIRSASGGPRPAQARVRELGLADSEGSCARKASREPDEAGTPAGVRSFFPAIRWSALDAPTTG